MATPFPQITGQQWHRIAITIGVIASTLGATVLTGWALQIPFVKNVLPGLPAMKPNTALGMLFSGIAFVLVLKSHRRAAGTIAFFLLLLGTATLTEYFLDFDLKIDQLLFRDTEGIQTTNPGRMSPSSAFCFIVVSAGIFVSARQNFTLRRPLTTATGATLLIIGALNLMGHISNVFLHWQWWNYTGVALHTALGFLLLGFGFVALIRGEHSGVWLLGRTMTAGFVVCVISLLAIGTVSFHFTKRLQQTSVLVYHTQAVLKEIENVRAGMADLESSQRGFLITGKPELLLDRESAKQAVVVSLAAIRRLVTDDPAQQARLGQLDKLVPERIEFGEKTIRARINDGWIAAQALIATGKGIRLTREIGQLLLQLRNEEYRLGITRETNAKEAVTSTFLFLPLGLFLSLAMVLAGVFLLNAGVAERRQVEFQVEFQASLLAQINDAVVAVDHESRITAWNHAAEKLYGWKAQEVMGRHSSQVIRSQLTTEARAAIWQKILEEGSWRNEYSQYHRDGATLQVEGNTIALHDEYGKFTGILSVNRDISERKRAEALRLFSEGRYRALFETLIEGFCTIELIFDEEKNPLDFRFIEVNPAFERQTGLQNIKGKFADDVTPGLKNYWLEIYGKVALTGAPLEFENEATILGRQYHVRAYRVGDGASHKVAILFNDITERKKAEERILNINAELEQRVLDRTRELQSQTNKLQQLIESSPDAIITLDLTRQYVTSWNSSAELMYGYTAAEAIGKTTNELVTTERINATPESVSESLAETGQWHGEIIQYNKWGKKLYLLCSAAFIRDGDGKPTGLISINRDISRLKAHEREQQQLNQILERNMDQLTAANRELESFSYSVSHDLRAPLRGIDGWSLALIEDYGDKLDSQARQYLERVRSETKRMDLLVDAMLDLSRISRAEMQPERTDLSAIARTIASRLNGMEKERKVDWHIQPDLWVMGDPALVEIALSNLLGNAFKFTKKTANPRIEIGQSQEDARRPFFIRDNGAGFDMHFAKKLFGAFQRMHKSSDFPGTGIGLATVQRIIHRHGGEIWAEAAVNNGATFYFTMGETI